MTESRNRHKRLGTDSFSAASMGAPAGCPRGMFSDLPIAFCSPREAARLKKITKQTRFVDKQNYFNHLDCIPRGEEKE